MKALRTTVLLDTGKRYAFNEKLAYEFIREIEENVGGPPSGVQFLVLDGHELALEYMPFSAEAVEYVLQVEGYLDDTT